jgi:hypothetical protein
VLQTNSGVKDTYAQAWIDRLVKRSKEMQNEDSSRSLQSIVQELVTWVERHENEIFNPFLTMPGMIHFRFLALNG